jgi:hypothetical protein
MTTSPQFYTDGRFQWTKRPIVCMGWSNDEKLICVQEDGMVVLHDIFGKYLHTFSVIQKIQDVKVIDARIFTSPQNRTGVAVMTSNFKIFLINNIQEPKTRQLSELISEWSVSSFVKIVSNF